MEDNKVVESNEESKIANDVELNEKKDDNIKEKKSRNIKIRTLLVLAVLAIFILGSSIIYRANYIESLEIGEEYAKVFSQNVRYKVYIGLVNFLIVFGIVYITNSLIKKGLKKFFEEEKKELPKLPNKSIALVIALVTSIVVSNMFLQKTILFVNAAQFGIPDPMYGMDVGFYMFQALLIRTAFILWTYTLYTFNNLYCCVLHYYF